MSKQRKKLRCICKGKVRTQEGVDNQKHIAACPLALINRKDRR
jgi:hypothetical protein